MPDSQFGVVNFAALLGSLRASASGITIVQNSVEI
jgi:hypothetical protein